ncbi:hypothetical protein DFA_04509 [Cavenderia fasciculata]|uniref:Ankyrin repeat-containing protein n=1 Tax=Cavenderia fasciculata TaxID=261658 RepID=F4PPS8_CACFS|nr:uncharacterized protein DFA_04509 [Cavenderia fasciculata]EGG22391.1 hypothetical protein DFA_04509 [Cavenderia fasciculata]|eukprot:XP_004360242.1 hypothetical protein DFA_04509 [Cavenderia fasciculata]
MSSIFHSLNLHMKDTDNNNNNVNTTTTITFQSIFRISYIRGLIFNHLNGGGGGGGEGGDENNKQSFKKGRDIIGLALLGMITQYAMPWNFIKHYINSQQVLLKRRRDIVISIYCIHPNATLDTLKHLIEWSQDFTPLQHSHCYLDLLVDIAEYGHRDILEFLITQYYPTHLSLGDPRDMADIAAINGHLSTLQFIDSLPREEDQPRYYKEIMQTVAEYGHLNVLEYLHSQDEHCTSRAMHNAATFGHFDVVKFLHDNKAEGCLEITMNQVASNGYFEILKVTIINTSSFSFDYCFLHDNRSEGCTKNAMDWASEFGHFEIVKFLHLNRTEGCSTHAMDNAARNGHFEILEWLHVNRSEGCTVDAMDHSFNLKILEFLHLNRTEGCTKNAMDHASMLDLQMVSFLYKNRTEGCTLDAIEYAIDNNNLDILKFLHENRIVKKKYPSNLINRIVSNNGELEMIEYVHTQLKSSCTSLAVNNAAKLGRLDIIQYLDKHFKTSSKIWSITTMDFAGQYGHLDIITYLNQHRTEGATYRAMDMAAKYGHREIVEFLHYNRTEGCTTSAMGYAAQNGGLQIVEFLYNNRTEGCSLDVLKPNTYLPVYCQVLDYLLPKYPLLFCKENISKEILKHLKKGYFEAMDWFDRNII